MLKKKEKTFTVLLVIFYALFMYQEIIVCQLLCCKANGSRDIELALFSFQCNCRYNDQHRHIESPSPISPNRSLVSLRINGCLDLPLETTWLNRNSCPQTQGVNFITQYYLHFPIEFRLNEPFRCLPEAVPLSKFLYLPYSPVNSVIQRC